ncbi:MAG: lectin-like protein, partial [Acidimicrobiales bacterium]
NLYEYVPTTPAAISWTNARTAALARTFGPYSGHLANLTSAEENDVALDELAGNTWIGAADSAVEGEWRWMDGPEAGQLFWGARAPLVGEPRRR